VGNTNAIGSKSKNSRAVQKIRLHNSSSNLEEHALKMCGDDIYNTFIKGYTEKQWGGEPQNCPLLSLNVYL